MRRALLLLLICAGYCHLSAQRPGQLPYPAAQQQTSAKKASSRILAEQCNNNIDDDGNGLIDCEDYSCFYSNRSACNCAMNNVIWVCSGNGSLYWINHETGIEKYVGYLERPMMDITWSPDGNLYGVDAVENKLWKIDPATAQMSFVASIPGYRFSNALTTDGNGNFYLASVLDSVNINAYHVIRLDAFTGVVTMIANLDAEGLSSAGDVALHENTLYVACNNNFLAAVNVASGVIGSAPISGMLGGGDIYGIVIRSDGTIYLGDANKMYKLDMFSMQATLYYTSKNPITIWGMASFNDYCVAPNCNASVFIDIKSAQPFCTDTGVQLKANGTGLGNADYTWTLPNGNILTNAEITATKSGAYIVKYSIASDTCMSRDTIVLNIEKAPESRLGNDTSLCIGTSITLEPVNTANTLSFLWSNGSTAPKLSIHQPGIYWMQASNSCGFSTDTVIVMQKKLPDISLGSGFEICEYDTLLLKNLHDAPGYNYTWSDHTKGKTMIVQKPGKYWLDAANMCGVVSDTITISKKTDNCDCYLYMPTGFTPNGDGKNDQLKAHSNCVITGELLIYNRWGQLIYHTKDLQNGWNGIYANIRQASGVFVYHVRYTYKYRPGNFVKCGTFVLIR